MTSLKSWRALLVREYLEHRMAFLYFPVGIVVLLAISAASAFGFHRIRLMSLPTLPSGLKIFELGYLALVALWLGYLAVTLFFYFGDAFSADRRNNAMLFWKSMPVSDLKVLVSKALAGVTLFPLIVLMVAMVTGLMLYLVVNLVPLMVPGLIMPAPIDALSAFAQVTGFGIVYLAIALLWFAPFLAWVGGLSTVFGRWSLPLAFVIPGLLAVVENIALYGNGPRGGYVWGLLSHRWQFGLSELDLTQIVVQVAPFDAGFFSRRLVAETDWPGLGLGLVFAAVVIWLASEYRRRRIA